MLVDGDLVIVNSADIVAYLEHRYREKPVYPADPAARVHARAWERGDRIEWLCWRAAATIGSSRKSSKAGRFGRALPFRRR